MIRAARFVDVPAMHQILRETHAASRYADLPFDDAEAHNILMRMVQRNGGKHDGGSLAVIAEHDGQPVAFMIGLLEKVYHVVDALAASDLFLCAREGAPATATKALLARYIQWAESNPKVREINLSWTDAVAGAERMGALYGRMGFRAKGGMFARAVGGGVLSLAS